MLSFLTKAISKILKIDGNISYKHLEDNIYRNKFSDYLPYNSYDPVTKAYDCTDNSIGFIWECTPLVYASEGTMNILEGFINACPSESVAQFILFADPYIKPFLDAHGYTVSQRKTSDMLGLKSVQYYHKFLQDGTKGLQKNANIPVRNFRLFVTFKLGKTHLKDTNLTDIIPSLTEALKGAGLNPRFMEPQDIIFLMHSILNNKPAEEKYYDPNKLIRKQIVLSESEISHDTRKGKDHIVAGGKYFSFLTPKMFPPDVDFMQSNSLVGDIWGIKGDFSQVTTPFMIVQNLIFSNTKGALHQKCNIILKQQGAGSFAPALSRKKEEFLWAVDSLEKGIKFLRIVPLLMVYSDSPEKTQESRARAKRIWESQGYVMQEDRGILPALFLSALPLGFYNVKKNLDNLERDFFVDAQAVVRTLPIQADFRGGGRPVLNFIGRKGQLAGLDIFDPNANNKNLYICGGSGGGKSFFTNNMAFSYFRSNSMIRIIDIGMSYHKLCNMVGGKYIDFGPDSNICINPFTNVKDIDEDLSVLSAIIIQMAYSTTDQKPQESEISLVKEACMWAWETKGTKASVTDVYQFLVSFPNNSSGDMEFAAETMEKLKTMAQMLAFNLRDFIETGTHGKWFNGEANLNISKDEFVVLELERLTQIKELFKVVTLQIVNEVTRDLYLSDRSRSRFIIFDEMHQCIKAGTMMKDIIETGYRRARKYGGSFTTITQSPLDLKMFGDVGDVIRNNSAFKFLLQSTDFEKARAEKILDYDDFITMILKSVKSNPPKYSEIFIETPWELGVGRFMVDPYSYFIYTSNHEDIAKIQRLVKEVHLTYDQAIEVVIRGQELEKEKNLAYKQAEVIAIKEFNFKQAA